MVYVVIYFMIFIFVFNLNSGKNEFRKNCNLLKLYHSLVVVVPIGTIPNFKVRNLEYKIGCVILVKNAVIEEGSKVMKSKVTL